MPLQCGWRLSLRNPLNFRLNLSSSLFMLHEHYYNYYIIIIHGDQLLPNQTLPGDS